jgi:hypothetical protein
MGLSVKERGESLATFRYIQVQLMETLARWVPTTPEMEVKLLFGAHIWDVAQHADALGKRVHELRMPLQHSLKPVEPYIEVLTELAATKETGQRVAAIYEVMLPCLGQRYRHYLGQTDPLMDSPTVRIVERILYDHARMLQESQALRDEVPTLALADPLWVEQARAREAAITDVVLHQSTTRASKGGV